MPALALDDEVGDRFRTRLSESHALHAPHLIDLEVVAALRRRSAAGQVHERRVGLALRDLGRLPLTRYPHYLLLRRAWQLRHNISPYDASYVALAEVLDTTLVTADARLRRAPGLGCAIEVLA